MVEKIAERFFYTVKYFKFSTLLLSDDKKSFFKDTQNSKNLSFAFSRKIKLLKIKSFLAQTNRTRLFFRNGGSN